jgi:iron-sulfur cluster repair protein YtfE (RIC family)
MGDTQILPTPPTAILKAAHEQMKELFARYESLSLGVSRAKQGIFHELQEVLRIHLEIEEILFYPAVEGTRSMLAIDVVLKALQAHRHIRELLAELRTQCSGNLSLDAKMDELRKSVLPHVREEEAIIFPYVRLLPREALLDLGGKMRGLQDRLKGNGGNPETRPGGPDPF